jgi:hypothetical protein
MSMAQANIKVSGISVFFYWRIFAKVRPEKCDFDHYKGFSIGKNGPNSAYLEKKRKFKSPYFLQ